MNQNTGAGGVAGLPDGALSMFIALNQQVPVPTDDDLLIKAAPPKLVEAIVAQAAAPWQPFAPDSGYLADVVDGFVYVVQDLQDVLDGPDIISRLYAALNLNAPAVNNPYSADMPALYVLQGRTVRPRIVSPARLLYDVWNSRQGKNRIEASLDRRLVRKSADPVHSGSGLLSGSGTMTPEYAVAGLVRWASGTRLLRIGADDSISVAAELRPGPDGIAAWHAPDATSPGPAESGSAAPPSSPAAEPQSAPPAASPPPAAQPVAPAAAPSGPEPEESDEAQFAEEGIYAQTGIMNPEWMALQMQVGRDMHQAATARAGDDWESAVEYVHRWPDGSVGQVGFLYAADGRSGPVAGPAHDQVRGAVRDAVATQRSEPWRALIFTVWRAGGGLSANFVYDDPEAGELHAMFAEPDHTRLRERLRPTRS